jgi:hypothetical protein
MKKTIFAAISLPYLIKDSNPKKIILNITKYITESSINYDYFKLTNNLNNNNIKNLIIITVIKDPNIKNVLEKIYCSTKSNESITKNYIVPINEFFSNKGIEKYLLQRDLYIKTQTKSYLPFNTRKKIKPGFIIYIFENIS